jgi:hypothetical protein
MIMGPDRVAQMFRQWFRLHIRPYHIKGSDHRVQLIEFFGRDLTRKIVVLRFLFRGQAKQQLSHLEFFPAILIGV